MNCKTFLDLLHEYLDEALDADVESAARQHFEQCPACCHALEREQILAKAMRTSLERATAGVSLRPQLQQNVICALEGSPAVSPSWWGGWPVFIFLRGRWIGSVGGILAVFALFFGLQFHRQKAGSAIAKATAPRAPSTWVITVPLQTQTHVFRQRDNSIEDAVISGTGVGYASFFEDRKPAPQPPSPKSL